MVIIFTLNKKIRLIICVFLVVNALNATNYLGSTSFGNHVYLYNHSKLVKVDLQSKQLLKEKNIKKDTITTKALIKIGMSKNNSSGNEEVMFRNINVFEILSIGNKKDSLYVAIRFKNSKNLNLYSYCLLRYDQNLNFHKVYDIKYPTSVSYNYFPQYKELEFTDDAQLRLLYCDSSKQFCQINFRFNENKNMLKSEPKSRVVVQHYTLLVISSSQKEIVSPNLYAIKGSDLYYMLPYPVFFDANSSQFLDPFNMKQSVIESDKKIHSKGFSTSPSMSHNAFNLNYILYHAVQESTGLQIYVKNIEKGVLQKLSFKNGSSSFVTEDVMPLTNELTYFFFTNNNQNYVLYEDEKIEIVKLP